MLSFFLYPMAYLLLMCAPLIHSEVHDKNSDCTDCIVDLESGDPLLQKYIHIVLEAVQNTSEDRLKIVNVENASYMVSEGILYEFTVHVTGLLQKINKTCIARVHQGYSKDDINIINLQCNEPEEVNECENCLESLDPENPFLQKYLKLVLEEIKNKTKSDLRLLAVEDTSFKVSNGVVFNFTLHLVDTTEELSTTTCKAIVHQGATIEEVNITTITCETKKIPECSDCEIDLKPDDPILGKYINITIEKLTENGTFHHFVGVKNPSYHVSNGIVYRFTILLTYGDSLENTKVCDAVVHQGYSHEDIEITQLLCITKEQDSPCTDCEVFLNSDDSILTKYVNVTLQTLQNKTGETPQLVEIQKASYQTLDDGISYKLIIIVTYDDQQKDTEACDVIVHQGFTPYAIDMKKLKCAKVEQDSPCTDCEVFLNSDDSILTKYVNVTLQTLQNKTGETPQLVEIQKASYQTLDDGILYKLIIIVTYDDQQKDTEACDVIVHQGFTPYAIDMKKLQCAKAEQDSPCTDCEVFLNSDDSILTKYVNVTLQTLQNKTGETPQLLEIQKASYQTLDDGISYKLIIIVTYDDQQKDTEACDVIVHQGFTPYAIDMKKLQCAKAEQDSPCTDCEVFLNSDDSILTKYVNVTLQTLQNKTGETPQLVEIQKASYKTLDDGISYKLIIIVTYDDQQKDTEACDVIVHQGFTPYAIDMKKLQCAKAEQDSPCTGCEVFLNSDDSSLTKYVNVTLQTLQNKTGETPQLIEIQKASYQTLDDGILYKLIIIVTYDDQQKDTEACDVIVHQGFTPDAIHMKKLQCAKAEQVK